MSKKQYNVRTAAVAATERRARRSGASVVAAGSGSSYNEVYGDIAGNLDNLAFFGTARGGGTHDFYQHARAEFPNLVRELRRAAMGL